mmetsp:Transcript_40675/g.59453  ORF Transcript_40675/g.59453 Transcript_40675/m.59453 type:complete len:89 (+) Transcript_40675:424-690(+)
MLNSMQFLRSFAIIPNFKNLNMPSFSFFLSINPSLFTVPSSHFFSSIIYLLCETIFPNNCHHDKSNYPGYHQACSENEQHCPWANSSP